MILEFNVYKLKESSVNFSNLNKYEINNEFIIVDETNYKDQTCVHKALDITEDEGLVLLADFKLDEMAYIFEKEDLILTDKRIQLDIPKERLTTGIIESIKKLNQGGSIDE